LKAVHLILKAEQGNHEVSSGGDLLLLLSSCALLLVSLFAGTALEVLKRERIHRIPPL